MSIEVAREALRPAAPEAKESDCTCGEQWPCPLHGGPPAAPEPTPSEKCPYCGLTTCRYGADPTSTCHAKGDSCRCSEQPDLPLGHEFVAGHPHPAYQSYCALRGIFGLCGQPESAHRGKAMKENRWSTTQFDRPPMTKPLPEETRPRKLSNAPCDRCGYNGPGYFQPEQHPCATEHHQAVALEVALLLRGAEARRAE